MTTDDDGLVVVVVATSSTAERPTAQQWRASPHDTASREPVPVGAGWPHTATGVAVGRARPAASAEVGPSQAPPIPPTTVAAMTAVVTTADHRARIGRPGRPRGPEIGRSLACSTA